MPECMLCDYFNREGKRVERIYIATHESDDAADKLRLTMRGQNLARLHDAIFAKAAISGATTSLDDAALALNTLLHEVADERMPLAEAREIATIGINCQKSVAIEEIIPALEKEYGGYAISWAPGIFSHLALGNPYIH